MPGQLIETDRLRLRQHRVDDFESCFAMWSDPAVVRFLGAKPATREEAWVRLLRYVGHWTLLGYGMWAVENRTTGEYVGDIGFFDAKRDLVPPFGDTPEIGWVLASRMQGRGYATEAVRAAVGWADQRFSGGRTVCLIHPENLPSLRVAEKCGYRECHLTTYQEQPAIILERLT